MIQDTSRAAKRNMDTSGKALSLRERVYLLIAHTRDRGLTDEELFDLIRPQVPGVKEGTIRARRCELRDAQRIEEHGTRPTKSGERAIVWVVAKRQNTTQGHLGL